jgi:hypothetical protein
MFNLFSLFCIVATLYQNHMAAITGTIILSFSFHCIKQPHEASAQFCRLKTQFGESDSDNKQQAVAKKIF